MCPADVEPAAAAESEKEKEMLALAVFHSLMTHILPPSSSERISQPIGQSICPCSISQYRT